MSKFKLPTTKSFKERLELSVSQGWESKNALRAVNFSLTHPSSLAEKQEQTLRAIRERDAAAKKRV